MERAWIRARFFIVAIGLAIAAQACSSSNNNNNQPTPTACNTPSTSTTIVISGGAACPQNITVARGSRVTMVNQDSVAHEMYSDPHPEHTDCPEFDSVGRLPPGTTRQTKNLTVARTCGFHDHINPFVASLAGSIRIQ